MAVRYLVTVTAHNRPGALAALSNAMAELGGDMVEADQTVVHGMFVLAVAADFPDRRTGEVIREHLADGMRAFGCQVNIQLLDVSTQFSESRADDQRFFVTVAGRNEPGVARAVSSTLARHSIDIRDLYGARTKEGDFSLALELAAPGSMQVDELADELTRLAEAHHLRIEIRSEEAFTSVGGGTVMSPPAMSTHVGRPRPR